MQLENDRIIREKIIKYDNFMNDLTLLTGKPSPMNDQDIYVLHHNLAIEQSMNLTMEPWMRDLLSNGILTKKLHLLFELANYNDQLKRLNGGEYTNTESLENKQLLH